MGRIETAMWTMVAVECMLRNPRWLALVFIRGAL